MKRNVGEIDRSVRLIAALLLAGLYFGGLITGTVATILLILSITLFLSGLASTCPLYSLFRISTCSFDRKAKP